MIRWILAFFRRPIHTAWTGSSLRDPNRDRAFPKRRSYDRDR